MKSQTPSPLHPFDLSPLESLTASERLDLAVTRARELVAGRYEQVADYPPIPPIGATPQELNHLERSIGTPLPAEYRLFLSRWRYLDCGTGLLFWGLPFEGVSLGSPWVSEEHQPGKRYLVFADYWAYADGDQLMFDLDDPSAPVVLYLHEHGPLIVSFAPSFSLALCRALGAAPPALDIQRGVG